MTNREVFTLLTPALLPVSLGVASWSRQKRGQRQIFFFIPHVSSPHPSLTPHLSLSLITSCPGDDGGLLRTLSAMHPPCRPPQRPSISTDSTSVAPHCLFRRLRLVSEVLCLPLPRLLFYLVFLSCLFPHGTCPDNFLSPAGDRRQEPRALGEADRDGCAATGLSLACTVTLPTRKNSSLSVTGSCKFIPSSRENKKGDEAQARGRTGPHPRCLLWEWGSEIEDILSPASPGLSVLINDSSLYSLMPAAG